MPNVGIKSIYRGLGAVKNRTFKLTLVYALHNFAIWNYKSL